MFTSVSGRSVIVTGATRGIGQGIARVFVQHGAEVLITGRDEAAAHATCTELNSLGAGSASYLMGDLTDRNWCKELVSTALSRHGGIDILCANAGISPLTPLADMREEDFDLVMDTNVKGTVLVIQACLAALTESGRGRVILTSSITGPVTGYPGWSHYGASKAAQLGFMRSAAIELAPRQITVNAVLPGNIATEGLSDLGHAYRSAMEMSIPMRRLGSVADIGHACVFFASDEAAYITGQSLIVDGGQILPESLAALD